ncbi:MAG: FISUMP domain-containing protein [Tenuifilaceae bacterium]|jgi:uncharacterized protein (TIGR02145 family)|nr:FISUMP domain-containing protein [Tenuifilaceae bacterium]
MRKNELTWKGSVVSIGLLFLLISGCNKDENLALPTIGTPQIFSLSSNAITIKCAIPSGDATEFIAQGVCWSTSPNPTVNSSKANGDFNNGIMYCRIEDLVPNTQYYARVFATNRAGTSYGLSIPFTTNGTISDIDGNIYNTVTIGSQVWLVENLKATKLNDGTQIEFIDENSTWDNIASPSFCFYDNSFLNKNFYGALYNLPAVTSGKLCPTGWHVPSEAEWAALIEYLGGEFVAATLLKDVGASWEYSNDKATNYSGFSALPSGASGGVLGTFSGMGTKGSWWSSTIDNTSYGDSPWSLYWEILDNNVVQRGSSKAEFGGKIFLSVRCIKN